MAKQHCAHRDSIVVGSPHLQTCVVFVGRLLTGAYSRPHGIADFANFIDSRIVTRMLGVLGAREPGYSQPAPYSVTRLHIVLPTQQPDPCSTHGLVSIITVPRSFRHTFPLPTLLLPPVFSRLKCCFPLLLALACAHGLVFCPGSS